MMSGLVWQKVVTTSRMVSRTGSTRDWMLEEEERDEMSVKKLVMQETMQEFEAVRTERRMSARFDTLRHEMIWKSSINELARRLSEVMFR